MNLPFHILRGDNPHLDVVLTVGSGFLTSAVALSVPLVLYLGGIAVWPGLAALGGGWWWSTRRPVRSCAAPMGERAVFLLGVATLGGLALGTSQALWAIVAGLVTGPLVVATTLLAVWWVWGCRPTPFQLRTPWFRVLGDNPAALTLLMKVKLDGPMIVHLDRCADGPVSAVLYGPSLRPIASVSWDMIRTSYTGGSADVVLEAPPGRYLLSVRHYRPWDTWIAPRVVAA